MAMMDSREAIFTIELPDGQVYTGSAMTVEISEEPQVRDVFPYEKGLLQCTGPPIWEIELRGIGPLAVKGCDAFQGLLERGPSEPEGWECPYCGRNWRSTRHKCWDGVVGCGASRPAMWWI